MKLFKCPNCGEFSRDADAIMPLKTRIMLHRDQTWSVSGDCFMPYHEKTEELNLSSTSCIECQKGPLELIETEQCPHKTNKDSWNYYGATRRCRLCGEEQRAKTILFE